MTAFMTACIFVVLAEMGDKTQLLAMAFATKYNWKTVMAGVFAATVFNHLFAVAVGSYLTEFVPMSTIQLAASVSFIIFGLWTIRGDKLEGEDKERGMSPFWTGKNRRVFPGPFSWRRWAIKRSWQLLRWRRSSKA